MNLDKVIKIAVLEALAQDEDEDEEENSNVEYMWVSYPGSCEECQTMNGERRSVNGEYESGLSIPVHPRCKCREMMVAKH